MGWSEAAIQPVHKKGGISSPDNYIGISLLNVNGKMYSYILNTRLTIWLEDGRLVNATQAEGDKLVNATQAGFRQGYSTIDHVCTLLALKQKQLLTHDKLYVAFIDFQKAFDFVDRNRLWDVLRKKWCEEKNVQSYKKYL